jgi:hypothetical protein
MTELNESIRHIRMPSRIAKLPISDTGFPIPWFVPHENDQPIMQASDAIKRMRAARIGLCWICGEPLGRFKCFILGPMCCITRTTAEPPCHHDCSFYAVQACPHLKNPKAKRNPNLPPGYVPPPGVALERNPGCNAIWTAHDFHLFSAGDGFLFRVGAPVEVTFYREGRQATRAEVMENIESGLPTLRDLARLDGREAMADLELDYRKALELLPAA